MAKNQEIIHIFQQNAIVALCHFQNALVSKRRTLLSWKVVKRCKFSTFNQPDEHENFDGSLVFMTSRENSRKYVCFRRLRSHLPYISRLETWKHETLNQFKFFDLI